MHASAATTAPQRVLAVDVLRGLVLFLLLPDLAGGFSFYVLARVDPGNPVWRALGAQFRHVDWTGVAIWDLVMPLFVFMVGVSMALSYARRRQAGQSDAGLLGHALLRAISLLFLGLLLQYRVASRVDELLPFVVLSTGLPMGRWWNRLLRHGEQQPTGRFDAAYAVVILALVGAWMAAHFDQLGHFEIGSQILALLGLAYVPAFLAQRFNLRTQMVTTVAILAAYGLAFSLYTAPTSVGPGGAAALSEAFSQWNQGTNVAAAFDDWLFALLPRTVPYRGNSHDYHSLTFVPMIAAIMFGAIVGKLLAQNGPSRRLALRLTAASLAGLALSGLMSLAVAPLLKSLWSPTWGVFSSSACLLMLGSLMMLFGRNHRSRWALPLVVLGTNSLLLYVLVFTERWRIVNFWDRLLGGAPGASTPWWPLVESGLVLSTLWLLAFLLYRAKVFVRL